MSVYFVFRGNTAGPGCKHVHRVEADTILDVFRANWHPIADPDEFETEVWRHGESVFGPGYFCLSGLAYEVFENDWPAPQSFDELHERLHELAAGEIVTEVLLGPHHLQILDTDDVYESALYVFDDQHVAEHPGPAAFLLPSEWELPDGFAVKPFEQAVQCQPFPHRGKGEGCTFALFLGVEDHHDLQGLEYRGIDRCCRIDGVRLPELPRYLLENRRLWDEEGPNHLHFLAEGLAHYVASRAGYERAFLDDALSGPSGEVAWLAYSDWLKEQGRPSAGVVTLAESLRCCTTTLGGKPGNRPLDLIAVHDHVTQACKQMGTHRRSAEFRHFILFDDLWAAAHPDLANGALRFASRWDVL
jgi:uncharacterized protein (TIGR02996 family)